MDEKTGYAAVVAALATHLIPRLFKFRKERFSEEAEIRKELRTEVVRLNKALASAYADCDVWRGKYYELLDERYRNANAPKP